MEIDADILIVGGGPAGSAAALRLAQRAPALAGRILLLDQANFPREKLCGGGITPEAHNFLHQLEYSVQVPNVTVKTLRQRFSEFGLEQRGSDFFYVVRRNVFDAALLEEVRNRGIVVYEGLKVSQIERDGDSVVALAAGRKFRAQIVIGADGVNSVVRRSLGKPDRSGMMLALESLLPLNTSSEGDFYLGLAEFDFRIMANGIRGYCWSFPSLVNGKPFWNLGIADMRFPGQPPAPPMKRLLLEWITARGFDIGGVTMKGYPSRVYDPNEALSSDRILLAGDAAGIEPLYGAGIGCALGSGIEAADAAIEALSTRDFRFLGYRERLRHSRVGRMMRRARLIAERFYGGDLEWQNPIEWGERVKALMSTKRDI